MDRFKAKNAGMHLHKQIKKERAFNEMEKAGIPQNILEWLNSSLNGSNNPCGKYTWRNFLFFLRDGVVLCKVINMLREQASLPPVKFCPNATTQFIAIDNIDAFIQGAKEYGVEQEFLFVATDLYEGQHKGLFGNVMVCIHHLAMQANQQGFKPMYTVVDLPAVDGVNST